ncbi:hypothetical protein COD75_00780, partial [Bacillus anthracis]
RESEMTDCSSHRSWISFKAEAARSESLFSIDWPRILVHEIYISDFSIISTYRQIKTISAPLPTTFINILQSLLC